MNKRLYTIGDTVFLKETSEIGVITQINKGISSIRTGLRQDGIYGPPTGPYKDEYVEVYSVNVGEALPRLVFNEELLTLIKNRHILSDILKLRDSLKQGE